MGISSGVSDAMAIGELCSVDVENARALWRVEVVSVGEDKWRVIRAEHAHRWWEDSVEGGGDRGFILIANDASRRNHEKAQHRHSHSDLHERFCERYQPSGCRAENNR